MVVFRYCHIHGDATMMTEMFLNVLSWGEEAMRKRNEKI
jgi:hypothetical protein